MNIKGLFFILVLNTIAHGSSPKQADPNPSTSTTSSHLAPATATQSTENNTELYTLAAATAVSYRETDKLSRAALFAWRTAPKSVMTLVSPHVKMQQAHMTDSDKDAQNKAYHFALCQAEIHGIQSETHNHILREVLTLMRHGYAEAGASTDGITFAPTLEESRGTAKKLQKTAIQLKEAQEKLQNQKIFDFSKKAKDRSSKKPAQNNWTNYALCATGGACVGAIAAFAYQSLSASSASSSDSSSVQPASASASSSAK